MTSTTCEWRGQGRSRYARRKVHVHTFLLKGLVLCSHELKYTKGGATAIIVTSGLGGGANPPKGKVSLQNLH